MTLIIPIRVKFIWDLKDSNLKLFMIQEAIGYAWSRSNVRLETDQNLTLKPLRVLNRKELKTLCVSTVQQY